MSIPKMIKELSLSFSTPLPPLLPSPRPILSSDAALMHVLHERERERERESERHTHTHTQRQRQTEKTDRYTDRQTQTQTQRETAVAHYFCPCGQAKHSCMRRSGYLHNRIGRHKTPAPWASTAGGPGLINKTQSTLDLPGPVVRQRKGAARGPAPIAMLCTLLWPQAAGRRRPGLPDRSLWTHNRYSLLLAPGYAWRGIVRASASVFCYQSCHGGRVCV